MNFRLGVAGQGRHQGRQGDVGGRNFTPQANQVYLAGQGLMGLILMSKDLSCKKLPPTYWPVCFTPLASDPTQCLMFFMDFMGRRGYILQSTLRSSGLNQVAWSQVMLTRASTAEVRPS